MTVQKKKNNSKIGTLLFFSFQLHDFKDLTIFNLDMFIGCAFLFPPLTRCEKS